MPRYVVAAVGVAVLFAAGCSSSSGGGKNGGKDGGTVSIGETGVVQKWDPHAQDWGTFLQPMQAAYDTLIRKNEDGTYSPALAAKWSYAGPTTFDLTLRSGLVFSDGTKLDAAAVVTNLENAQTHTGPKTPLIKGWQAKTTGDLGVEITLPAPQPDVELILSQNQGMMVSPKALANYQGLNSTPVGDGPYMMDSAKTVANDHYTFVKNPKYWNAKAVRFSTLVFKVYTDSTAQLHALQSGQIDAMAGDSTSEQSAKSSGMTIDTYLSFFMGLSLQGQTLDTYPFLKNQLVRQAMQYAVDRKELQITIGAGQPTTQIFPPGSEGFDASLDTKYPHDTAKAKALLAQAGYPNGISFTVQTIAVAFFPRYIQALQSELAAAGIKMKINTVQFSKYSDDRNGKDNPVYAWYYNPVNAYFDADQILTPDGGFNPFHITDSTITGLFTKAASETDPAARATLFKQISARFVDESYHVITNFGDGYYFYNPKKIAKWDPTVLEAMPFIYDLNPAS